MSDPATTSFELGFASHFELADTRPMAPAMVEVGGSVNGTTKTVERKEAEASPDLVLSLGGDVGVRISVAWLEPPSAPDSSNFKLIFSVCARVEGIGMVWDARSAEYWRSHIRSATSRGDVFVNPARRTNEEPRAKRDISWDSFLEDEKAERDDRWTGSDTGHKVVPLSAQSNWKEYHVPELAVREV